MRQNKIFKMIVKQNQDKTVTMAKFKGEIRNPVTQSRVAKCDFQIQLSVSKGIKYELNPANNLIQTSNAGNNESIQQTTF